MISLLDVSGIAQSPSPPPFSPPFCLFSCVGGGHYVAYVYSEGDTKGWHYFSDSHVARRSEREVLKAEAYLLFYARVDDR